MTRRPPNCLQRYRKRNGITQEEMAFLLGCNTPAQVSQYERLRRQPSGETMLRCQAVFGAPVDKLFPVLSDQVELETKKRARELRDRIGWPASSSLTGASLFRSTTSRVLLAS